MRDFFLDMEMLLDFMFHCIKLNKTTQIFSSFPQTALEENDELCPGLLCTNIIKMHIPKRQVTENGCKRGWY